MSEGKVRRCPGEMSAEQRAEWARNQQPASPEQRAAIDSALSNQRGEKA